MSKNWESQYSSKIVTAEAAIKKISSGKRVFIGSFCGEPQHLVSALLERTAHFFDIEVVRFLNLEGSLMGLVADETHGMSYNVRSIYQGSGMVPGLAATKRFLTPMNLFSVPQLFLKRHIPIHYALIQVSPPDSFGWMNLGVSVDITLAAAQTADVVIAQVNPRVPRVPGYGMIHLNDIDFIVEKEEELLEVYPTPEMAGAKNISRLISNLVEDGSTVQIGPGFPTELIMDALIEKKDLGVHSQFVLDAMALLVERGVITNRKKGLNDGKLLAGGALGTEPMFRYLDGNPGVEFRPSDYVSNPAVIAKHNKMTSINLVTKVDLKGQVAADAMAQNHFADVTGMIDFCRGASMSPQGKSILVVSSASIDGKTSNIIPEISAGSVAVPASDVTYVVSEYGTVNLFGKNVQERAMAMISLAHPSFREELFNKAMEIGNIGKERTLKESIYGVYPAWMEEVMELGGKRITLRPAKSVDDRLIQEHFYEMEMTDVAQRFFGPRRHFHRDEVETMFNVDYNRNFTIVAFIGEVGFGKIVGIGSYFKEEGKGIAEVAYSVSKDWQGKGVAVTLQRKIVEAARENGLSGIFAITNSNNMSMIKLFKKLPYKISTEYDEGTVMMNCRFDEQV